MAKHSETVGIVLQKQAAQGKTFEFDIELLAMLEGINHTFFISTIFALVALLLALFIRRPKIPNIHD